MQSPPDPALREMLKKRIVERIELKKSQPQQASQQVFKSEHQQQRPRIHENASHAWARCTTASPAQQYRHSPIPDKMSFVHAQQPMQRDSSTAISPLATAIDQMMLDYDTQLAFNQLFSIGVPSAVGTCLPVGGDIRASTPKAMAGIPNVAQQGPKMQNASAPTVYKPLQIQTAANPKHSPMPGAQQRLMQPRLSHAVSGSSDNAPMPPTFPEPVRSDPFVIDNVAEHVYPWPSMFHGIENGRLERELSNLEYPKEVSLHSDRQTHLHAPRTSISQNTLLNASSSMDGNLPLFIDAANTFKLDNSNGTYTLAPATTPAKDYTSIATNAPLQYPFWIQRGISGGSGSDLGTSGVLNQVFGIQDVNEIGFG